MGDCRHPEATGILPGMVCGTGWLGLLCVDAGARPLAADVGRLGLFGAAGFGRSVGKRRVFDLIGAAAEYRE